MWSHYANFHKGFLLEYDLDEIRNFVDGKGVICPIEYKKTFKKIGTLESSFTDIIIDNFLTKVEDWNYENEWRIIGIKMTGLQKFIPPKKVYLGCKMETGTRKRVKEICKKKHIPIYEMIMDESEYKLNEILYSTR